MRIHAALLFQLLLVGASLLAAGIGSWNLLSNSQHRAGSLAHHSFGNATEEHPREASPTMRRYHEQIGLILGLRCQDRGNHVAVETCVSYFNPPSFCFAMSASFAWASFS